MTSTSDNKYVIPAAGRHTSQQLLTSEPSFIRKKKEQGHNEKRTHTTNHDTNKERESASWSIQYKAGYRREINLPVTEYQLHYGWKSSQLADESPVMMAVTRKGKENRSEPLLPAAKKEQKGLQKRILKETNVPPPLKNTSNDKMDTKVKSKQKKKVKTLYNDHTLKVVSQIPPNVHVPSEPHSSPFSSPAPPPSPPPPPPPPPPLLPSTNIKPKSSQKKRNYNPLVTEYRAQFESPKEKFEKGCAKVRAGSATRDQVLAKDLIYSGTKKKQTDELIHKEIITTSKFAEGGTEYSSSFVSPTQLEYANGVWQRPIQSTNKEKSPLLHTEDSPSVISSSWYDQVLELREKAGRYKMRGDGTYRDHCILQFEEKEDTTLSHKNDKIIPQEELPNNDSSSIDEDSGQEESEINGICTCTAGTPHKHLMTYMQDGHHISSSVPLPSSHGHHIPSSVPLPSSHGHHIPSSVPLPSSHGPHIPSGVPPPSSHGHHIPSSVPPLSSHGHHIPSSVPPPSSHSHHIPSSVPPSSSYGHHILSSVPPSSSHSHYIPSSVPPPSSHGHHIPLKTSRSILKGKQSHVKSLATSKPPLLVYGKPSSVITPLDHTVPPANMSSHSAPIEHQPDTNHQVPSFIPSHTISPHIIPPHSQVPNEETHHNQVPSNEYLSHHQVPSNEYLSHDQVPSNEYLSRHQVPSNVTGHPSPVPPSSTHPSPAPIIKPSHTTSDIDSPHMFITPSVSCDICGNNNNKKTSSHKISQRSPQSCSICSTCNYTGATVSNKNTSPINSKLIQPSSSSNCNLCKSALQKFTRKNGEVKKTVSTPAVPLHSRRQEDSFSVSTVSLSSSCSIASDLLAKARKRQNFWSTQVD